jgi:ectoine hydroxylase-related dioxygenase (phytanoyl-CoA dioxygenase family)
MLMSPPTFSSALRKLSADERQTYERDGFVAIPDVIPADELMVLDQELDRLSAIPANDAGPNRKGWIYAVGQRSDMTKQFAADARLLSLVEDVVFPGIAIHSSKLVTKMPQSLDICHWHQDEAFYTKPDDPTTHAQRRMSVWVPLQDTDEHNGCLWVVPGSQRWDIDPWTTQETGTCVKRINRVEYADEHAVPLPVRTGTVVLFSAYTWHHSKNNQTDQIRRAFIVSYQEATAPRGAGDQRIVLRSAEALP